MFTIFITKKSLTVEITYSYFFNACVDQTATTAAAAAATAAAAAAAGFGKRERQNIDPGKH